MRRFLCLLLLIAGLPVAAAERVISLAPSLTDMVLELGAADRLAGLLDGGPRPEPLKGLPSVGRYGQVNLEQILALHPDLLLVWPGAVPDAQLRRLKAVGIPLYVADPHRLDDISRQFRELGERLGQAEKGRALAQAFDVQMAQLRAQYRREQPLRVFYQVWDRPLYTVGGRQIISEALEVCGGRNLFADLDLPAPQVGQEAVLARDPQVILAASDEQLSSWTGMRQLSATRLKQLWVVPDRNLEKPSFAMLDATGKLCRLLAGAKADD
ncbi:MULTISPECIES: cobalamin-binding protein [Pseudomonas]|uniref:Cobalamin-binding protein n=1 Tax=Pseudomonas nitroreducens TaxID=46680 RepID=A0ABS0KMD1_PSENT|nr:MULTISPECIES: cobalamin-binding protein [Pseudomonas]MBG6289222.1 cobalamin-binding protein [Pseudomonas nitroreducens]MCJ1881496.1 cobalamin-binding protein [Pseudomonas nitroreducens]MCJ1897928.1 cobalamin-binding protein [Pseudomonas nitroreducens]MDG9854845.1 cobalamin-binding protein [Pseudomonas nitroreducens]MDH1074964.1 cobalamin-binding protein [Pseudomonas nitroreducens]